MASKKGSGGQKSSSGGDKDHRSAISGRYVKDSYAKSHPKTTVSETRPGKSPPGTKGRPKK